jgi:glycosyltransferase involved in cell wall biosynthesis
LELTHIYWFTHFNLNCPSARYRGKYPLEHLKERYNITYDLVYPGYAFGNIMHFLRVYFSVLFFRKENSLIVFQKIKSNKFYSNALKLLLRIRSGNTIYDIDDAEYLRHDPASLIFFMKYCSTVSVAGSALRDHCLKHNPNVVVNTSPVTAHDFRKEKKNQVPVIGWVGDYGNGNVIEKEYSHKASLTQLLFPVIRQLPFNIKFVLIGVKEKNDIPEIKNHFSDCPHVELVIPENPDWMNDAWMYGMISSFDIGVSPMLDFEFNRAKSAFKAKQYLSCGVPCIASDVGENSTFVKHNVNGRLCNTTADFRDAIEYICNLEDKDHRRLREAALNSKKDFSMEQYCTNLINLYRHAG